MKYTEQQRDAISAAARGKTVAELEWEDADGGYWVMTFTDGSELCFRFAAELQ